MLTSKQTPTSVDDVTLVTVAKVFLENITIMDVVITSTESVYVFLIEVLEL